MRHRETTGTVNRISDTPGDLLDPGIEPRCPALQADALPSEPPGKNVESQHYLKGFSLLKAVPPSLFILASSFASLFSV